MKIKNGFLTQDCDGAIKFHTKRPGPPISTNWYTENYITVYTEMFDDLDLGDDYKQSLRQVVNGNVIMPLPELRVDDRVQAWRDGKWCNYHYACFDGDVMFVFTYGRTSWSAGESQEIIAVEQWKLPEEGQNND